MRISAHKKTTSNTGRGSSICDGDCNRPRGRGGGRRSRSGGRGGRFCGRRCQWCTTNSLPPSHKRLSKWFRVQASVRSTAFAIASRTIPGSRIAAAAVAGPRPCNNNSTRSRHCNNSEPKQLSHAIRSRADIISTVLPALSADTPSPIRIETRYSPMRQPPTRDTHESQNETWEIHRYPY